MPSPWRDLLSSGRSDRKGICGDPRTYSLGTCTQVGSTAALVFPGSQLHGYRWAHYRGFPREIRAILFGLSTAP